MPHDPDFCRAQAAGHRIRAAASTRARVRDMELKAAANWLRAAGNGGSILSDPTTSASMID